MVSYDEQASDYVELLTPHVFKNNLARYYLRVLELYEQKYPAPELKGILEDIFVFNLEHIMPQSPSDAWDVTEETAQAYGYRLGNIVLFNLKMNVKIAHKPFSEKKLYTL